MKWIAFIVSFIITTTLFTSCQKDKIEETFTYYEVGFNVAHDDWRDSLVIIRTNSEALIQKADAQLLLPVDERQIVFGEITTGNGGYNKNASHSFNWRYQDNAWDLVDITAEIYDGRPYSDVEVNATYWQTQMERFGSWGSYIKKKLP
ncbi:MAG: hypothetical protein H0V30_02335 [Chitinophagaceae bacterium]|nr:hypothetical protein [Chitinophagaceae bacterium]